MTVIVTVLNDLRVARTLESIARQDRPAASVLVDDGSTDGNLRSVVEQARAQNPTLRHLSAPGPIPESRNAALRSVDTEFVAFIDADELAPPSWLRALLAPFDDPTVGFTGGPTPAIPETVRSFGARYYDGYLRRFYDRVARAHPHALPMGNSAWRMQVFRDVGLLDTTLFPQAASEDQELAVRALAFGWKGVYVPEAEVFHDFSNLTTTGFLAKQARYSEGGYVVWRRKGSTYEASPTRLLPYVLLPAFAIGGAVLLVPATTRELGFWILIASGVGFALLALALTVSGLAEDRRYPGLRLRAFEILRRWATLWGALRGWRHYGWKGARSVVPPRENLARGKP